MPELYDKAAAEFSNRLNRRWTSYTEDERHDILVDVLSAFRRKFVAHVCHEPLRWMLRAAVFFASRHRAARRKSAFLSLESLRCEETSGVSRSVTTAKRHNGHPLSSAHRAHLNDVQDSAVCAHIRKAFQSLPENLQVMLTLRHVNDWPIAAAARELGIPPSTAASRLHRGERSIRDDALLRSFVQVRHQQRPHEPMVQRLVKSS